MVPFWIKSASPAWMPSSPELKANVPPAIVTVPLQWTESSEESIVNVPPCTDRDAPAFNPFALSEVSVESSVSVVSSLDPGPHIPQPGFLLPFWSVLAFALPPPLVIWKAPPSMRSTVSAWMPSVPAVM